MTLAAIENELIRTFRTNPKMVVWIRADKATAWEKVHVVMDMLSNRDITRYNFRSEPVRAR
jgi:biopolymer transport protein ExbD